MSSVLSIGYFLVFHGSRDRRPQLLLSELIRSLNKQITDESILTQSKSSQQRTDLENHIDIGNYTGKMSSSNTNVVDSLGNKVIPLVDVGSLELTPISLQKQLEKYAKFLQKRGCKRLKILPLFLVPGVHVCEDIPAEITPVQSRLAPGIKLELLPYLGSYPQILVILRKQFDRLPHNGKILLAHGTSYLGGNEWLKNLAIQLEAQIAYYSVKSSLQEQIELLISQQKQKITIVPYFLFPGKITDAIATEVKRLQQVYPDTELFLGKPLGATNELMNLIVEVLSI